MDYKAAAVTMLAKADEKTDRFIYHFLMKVVENAEVAPVQHVEKPVEVKTGFEIMSEVEDIAIHLNELPNVIQLLVENLKLDERELTKEEEYDYIHRRYMVYDVLTLVQRTLWEVIDGIDNIKLKKAQTTTESTDQSN